MDVLTAGTASVIVLLMFIGATGKSAQIPLFVWLPDAMAGPTPVSALIHAATMVTSGLYLLARLSPVVLEAPGVMILIAFIGAITAIMAATIAITQNDIKKVLAYSTVSQLGYMFVAAGVGAFFVAIFHVMTHAFFKACLFLGSGSVIHAMHHVEHDLQHKGVLPGHPEPGTPHDDEKHAERAAQRVAALRRTVRRAGHADDGRPPQAHADHGASTFLVSTLSIAGIPLARRVLLEGRDPVQSLRTRLRRARLGLRRLGHRDRDGAADGGLHDAGVRAHLRGPRALARRGRHEAAREPVDDDGPARRARDLARRWAASSGCPKCSARAGSTTGSARRSAARSRRPRPCTTSRTGSSGACSRSERVIALVGVGFAWLNYRTSGVQTDNTVRRKLGAVYTLLSNKYYVDEAYDATVVRPITEGARRGLAPFDANVVDGAVNGVASLVRRLSGWGRGMQTGIVQNYALALVLGVVVVVAFMIFV